MIGGVRSSPPPERERVREYAVQTVEKFGLDAATPTQPVLAFAYEALNWWETEWLEEDPLAGMLANHLVKAIEGFRLWSAGIGYVDDLDNRVAIEKALAAGVMGCAVGLELHRIDRNASNTLEGWERSLQRIVPGVW